VVTGKATRWAAAPAALAVLLTAGACGTSAPVGAAGGGPIRVVAAENQYGDVAAQVGGPYVEVTSVVSNPNADPHSYEVSPRVAAAVSRARIVVQNGLGYDDFIDKIEAASPSSTRQVIVAQKLLGLSDSTPNPHLWYEPRTMPAVAAALAAALSEAQPDHAGFFRAAAARFVDSLQPWLAAMAHFGRAHPGVPVATTEPVADYLLDAMGARNLTPFSFQAAMMNGVDPSPQDVATEQSLIGERRVSAVIYNEQVSEPLTESLVAKARRLGIPVVAVYETMPTPGYSYGSWMEAEVIALEKAVTSHVSTTRL
jgi:zinc/manganese transport system substrate-binding protein